MFFVIFSANYKDALMKIEKLKTKKNAFSTDTEADSLEKAARLERASRIEKLNQRLADAKSLVFGFDTESEKSAKLHKRMNKSKKASFNKESTSSIETESSNASSSSENETNQLKMTMQKIQKVKKNEKDMTDVSNVITKNNNNFNNQQPSTSRQSFPVPNTKDLNKPDFFDNDTEWDFPIDAVVDKNGLIVIPEGLINSFPVQ